jgi:pyruvate/2-oxoglutarate/acetoin dehydrogenase E1 component
VAISGSVPLALEAAKVLEKDGISLEIIDPMTIKPLDEDTIIESVKKTGRLMIVHEACRTGGFGAEVAALVSEKALDYLEAPIKRIAALDTPIPYSVKYEGYVFPGVNNIVVAAREIAK